MYQNNARSRPQCDGGRLLAQLGLRAERLARQNDQDVGGGDRLLCQNIHRSPRVGAPGQSITRRHPHGVLFERPHGPRLESGEQRNQVRAASARPHRGVCGVGAARGQ
uniref:Uncharacterized protein n=1 Tax=Cacopsylla melanoneura TaxID=428564 RepID=A0A8D8WDR4_9HEMI